MAKKKKRSWVEERDEMIAKANRLTEVEGSYEDRVKDIQSFREEREIAAKATKAKTSNGETISVTQAPDFVQNQSDINYKRHIATTLGRNFNGINIPLEAYKDYKSASEYMAVRGITPSKAGLLTQNEVQSNMSRDTEYNRILKATQYVPIVKNLTDQKNIDKVDSSREYIQQLNDDINAYIKKYGKDKTLGTIGEYTTRLNDFLKSYTPEVKINASEEDYLVIADSARKDNDKYYVLGSFFPEGKRPTVYEGTVSPKGKNETLSKPGKILKDDRPEYVKNAEKNPRTNTYTFDDPRTDTGIGASIKDDKGVYELSKKDMLALLQDKGLTKEEAKKYLKNAKEYGKQRHAQQEYEAGEAEGERNPVYNIAKDVGKSISSVPRAILGQTGLTDDFEEDLRYEEAGREETKKKGMNAVESTAYDIASFAGQLAANSAIYGGLGSVGGASKAAKLGASALKAAPFATEAAQESYYHALDNGASKDQAKLYGATSGLVSELLFSVGIDKIGKITGGANKGLVDGLAKKIVAGETAPGLGKALLQTVGKGAVQGGKNFAAITAVNRASDLISQTAILAENSDYKKIYNAYKDKGLSDSEAWRKTATDIGISTAQQIGQEAIKGAVMGAGGAIGGLAKEATMGGKSLPENALLRSKEGVELKDANGNTILDDNGNPIKVQRGLNLEVEEYTPEGNITDRLDSDVLDYDPEQVAKKYRTTGNVLGEIGTENVDVTLNENGAPIYDENGNLVTVNGKVIKASRTTKSGVDLYNSIREEYQTAKERLDNINNNSDELLNAYKEQGMTDIEAQEKVGEVKARFEREYQRVVNKANSILGDYEPLSKEEQYTEETRETPQEFQELKPIDNEVVEQVVEPTEMVEPVENAIGKSKSGKPIFIDKVEGTDVSFVDSEGNKVTDYELADTPQTELMELAIDKDYDTDTTKSMMKGFELANTNDTEAYAKNFNVFYTAGKDSSIKSFKDALAKAPELSSALEIVGTDAAGKAFSEGRKQVSPLQQKGLTKLPKGKFTNDTGKTNAATEYAEMFAIFSGGDVVATERPEKFISSKVEPGSIRGVYIEPEGKIIVDTKYTSFIRALNHEMKHLTDSFAIDEAKAVSDACMNFARNELGIKGVDDAIKNLQDTYKANGQEISYSEAQSEFINNMVGTAMASEEGIEGLIGEFAKDEKISAAKKQSIIQKFIEWIQGLIKKLKEYAKEGGAYEDTEFVLDEANKAQRQDIINKQIDALKASRKILEGLNKELEGKTGEETEEKFSMEKPVEETKDLIAVHNLTENKLLKSIDMGGFAMPSIAITKAEYGHSNFGDISVVFRRETIDPANSNNKVYSGDAWTPTMPEEIKKINREKFRTLSKDLGLSGDYKDIFARNDLEDIVRRLEENQGTKEKFAENNNHEIEKKEDNSFYRDETKRIAKYVKDNASTFLSITDSPEMQERLARMAYPNANKSASEYEKMTRFKSMLEHLTDSDEKLDEYVEKEFKNKDDQQDYILEYAELYDDLDSIIYWGRELEYDRTAYLEDLDKYIKDNKAEYEKWITDTIKDADIYEGSYFRKPNADPFTPTGRRRSFDALHIPYTLDNVIKQMKTQGKGEDKFFAGINTLRGAATREFESVEDIRRNTNRLTPLGQEEAQDKVDELNDKLHDINDSIEKLNGWSGNMFTGDFINETIAKAFNLSNFSEANVMRVFRNDDTKLTHELYEQLAELKSELQTIPAKYFEAKPRRAVTLDSIAYAIVPDNASKELLNALDENNIEYKTYEEGNEEQRKELLNDERVKFSMDENKGELVSAVDSEGNELSKEQQDYFKDSKVRDEEGRLEVVYHGSRSDFTIFDKNKTGYSATISKVGFWFTDSKEGALNFAKDTWYGAKPSEEANAYEGYINITKPKVYESVDNTTNYDEAYDKYQEAVNKYHEYRRTAILEDVSDIINIDEYLDNPINWQERLEDDLSEYLDVSLIEVFKALNKLSNLYDEMQKLSDDMYEQRMKTDAYDQFKLDVYSTIGLTPSEASAYVYESDVERALDLYKEQLAKEGYDGIIIKSTKYDKNTIGDKNNQYVIFNSNQFKNIDNKQPTTNEDIRYSIDKREDDEIEVDARERELKDANNVLANTMSELYDRKLNSDSANKIVRDMKKNFNIDLANATIKEQLSKVTDAIEKAKGNIKTSEVQKAAADFIKNMMRYSKGEIDDYNRDILENIKKTPILLSDELKNEIQDYGYWFRANRGKMMIRNNGIPLDRQWVEWADQYPAIFDATISDKDQPYELEKIINTLSEGIPFDDRPEAMEAYKTDLLLKIARQLDINNRNITKAYNRVARLINNDYKKRVREALKEQREYFNAEIAQMKLNERLRGKEQRIRRDTTKVRNDNIKLAGKIKRSLLKPTNKNRVPSVLQEPLLDFIRVIDAGEQRKIDYYNKKLEKLTDQLKYATGSQYDEIQRQIEDIKIKKGEVDLDSAFIMLENAFKNSKDELEANGELSQPLLDSLSEITGKRGFSETAKEAMKNAAENFGGRSINDLYLPEQKELNRVLRMIQTEINNYNKIIDNSIIGKDGRALHISDIVKEGANQIRLRDSKLIGSDNKVKQKVGKLINKKREFSTKNLRPDVVFKKLFGYHKNNLGGQIFNMLEQGYVDQENTRMKALNELQTMFETKEDKKHAADIQKYDSKHLYEVEINGQKVKLPKSMIIQIKLHLNNERNRAHLIGGGLTVPNLNEYFKTGYGLDTQQQIIKGTDAKVNAINKKIRNELNKETPDFEKIKSWDMDIEQILSEGEASAIKLERQVDKHLNDWDKKYINTHYKIFDGTIKKRLNRVTQLRWGTDLAQEDKYTRLISDKAYLKDTVEGNVGIETNQEQAGFMQQRTGARNPIILESCLNADLSQIEKSARYVGFMIPQHNLNRILKFTTDTEGGDKINLTKVIQQNYPSALDYIDDLKKSVFGGKPKTQHGGLTSAVMSIRAIEGLVGNVNVELLQAASYPLAASEIRYSSLLKALARGGKNNLPISRADRELIDSKTPLLWSRAADSMTEVEAAKNDKTFIGRAYSKLANNKYGAYLVGRIPKIDNATVGRLWYAAEYDVKQDIKDYNLDIKVGSEEYYDEVTKKFNKLTTTTQPMYDPLHRNEYQRSNNPIIKMLEMFKTVLVQAYNTVYDKQSTYKQYYEDYKNGEYGTTKEDVRKARKARNRAITSWILSMSLVAAIRQVIYSTLYHKSQDDIRDENGDLDFGRMAKYYADSLVGSLAGAFLLGSDLLENFEAATDKFAGYDNKYHGELSLPIIDMIQDTFNIVKNSPNLKDEKKRDKYLEDTFNTLVRTTGLPYKNTKRLVDGIFGIVGDIQDNGDFDYSNELEDSQKLRKWAKGDFTLDEVKDYFTSKQKVSEAIKKVYLDKDISSEKAVQKLVESGLYEGTKTRSVKAVMKSKVDKWGIDSYKDAYINSLTSKGAETSKSKEIRKKIGKLDYESAFWSNPANVTHKDYKSPKQKLENYIKKWREQK